MSLISVIVAAAIGSVVVLGMTQFQVNLMRSIAQVKKSSNLEILHSDILRHLETKEDCSEEPSPTNVQVGKSCVFKSPCDLLLAGVTKTAAYKQNKDEIKDKVTFTSASGDKDSTDTSTTSAANIYEKSEKYHDLRFVGMKVDKAANANKADLLVYFSTKQSNILLPDEYITIDLAIEYNTNGTLKRCYAKGGVSGANASLDCITIDDDSTTGKTLIGCGGTSDISANYNTFVGFGAGKSTELGSYGQGQGNSFFGYRAGYTNRSGRLNNFFGYQAGYSNNSGGSNNFFGWQAGYKNNSGTGNNFIGYHAGNKNTSGSYNNFFGRFAGSKNTSGRYNSFFGSGAGQHNTSGSNNIYIGNEVSPPNSSGTKAGISRTASNQLNIGDLILGKRNPTAIPTDTSSTPNENKINSITESSGVLIRGSLRCTEEPCGSGGTCTTIDETENRGRVLIGCGGTNGVTAASRGTFIGYGTGLVTTGTNNTFIGQKVAPVNTYGDSNTFIGRSAGYDNTTGDDNTFIGYIAGYNNTTANDNTFVGYRSGYANTTGASNSFFGKDTGYANTTGKHNSFFGYRAGYLSNTGDQNTFIGYQAGYNNGSGNSNTCIGYESCKGTYGQTLSDQKWFKDTPIPYSHSHPHSHSSQQQQREGSGGPGSGRGHGGPGGHGSGTRYSLPLKEYKNIAQLKSKNKIKLSETQTKKLTQLKNKDYSFSKVAAFGQSAGSSNIGDKNVFLGVESGKDNLLGELNTFIGFNSGEHSYLGSNNIYIGSNTGSSKDNNINYPDKNKSYQLNLGHTIYGNLNKNPSFKFPKQKSSLVIDARLTTSKDLKVYGNIKTKKNLKVLGSLDSNKATIKHLKVKNLEVENLITKNRYLASATNYNNPISSKEYKKNIKDYKDYEKSLKAILETPIYRYQYKTLHPNKKRIGVISENLDKSFQLKEKSNSGKSIIMPDWVSIYGSLIASVKALYKKINNLTKELNSFKATILNKVVGLDKRVKANEREIAHYKQQLENNKKELKEIKKQLKKLSEKK